MISSRGRNRGQRLGARVWPYGSLRHRSNCNRMCGGQARSCSIRDADYRASSRWRSDDHRRARLRACLDGRTCGRDLPWVALTLGKSAPETPHVQPLVKAHKVRYRHVCIPRRDNKYPRYKGLRRHNHAACVRKRHHRYRRYKRCHHHTLMRRYTRTHRSKYLWFGIPHPSCSSRTCRGARRHRP